MFQRTALASRQGSFCVPGVDIPGGSCYTRERRDFPKGKLLCFLHVLRLICCEIEILMSASIQYVSISLFGGAAERIRIRFACSFRRKEFCQLQQRNSDRR